MEELEIGGAIYSTRLTSKFKNRKSWELPNERKIFSVIPGTIQKVMVSDGEKVAIGDSMMILEAMKMRNEVKATHNGIVKRVNVKEGEHVSKAYLLLEFQ